MEAAQVMPDADYGFKPAAASEMRTYGQLFAHIATGQFSTCAAIKGVPNPSEGKNLERDLKSKADFVKALADSFAFLRRRVFRHERRERGSIRQDRTG